MQQLRPPRTDKPQKGTRLSAVEIHDNVLAGATEDSSRPTSSLWWSSLAAGLVIGFTFLASSFLSSLATSELAKRACAAAGYPLGFLFVVLGRMELYTENTLEPVIPLLHDRTLARVRSMFRLWAVLLVGNMIGAAAFAFLLARTSLVDATMTESLRLVAANSTSGGAGHVFYCAIFAGWLMALMSWLLGATTSRIAQIVVIVACSAAIGAFEFRHSIAGAVEAFYRVFDGSAGPGAMIGGFLIPAIVGNTLGGVVLVALLNYGQVKAELPPHPRTKDT